MREFTLPGFIAHLGSLVVLMPTVEHGAMEHAAQIVEKEAKDVIGTYRYGWPTLAESTLARKSADTPLLETGAMRDSIEHSVTGPRTAHVGSNDQNAVYQELGTSKIPPRSFLMGAAIHKLPEVGHAIGETIVAHLEGRKLPIP